MPLTNLPIIIIGAGIGGLSAAIRLASAGQRVLVLEANAAVGGKMSEVRAEGFRWDPGPSVITMRHVFDDTFAGRLADYLTLVPVDPLTRYFYPDGTRFDALANRAAMTEVLRQFADADDAAGYLKYLDYAKRIHDITGGVFIYNDPPTLWRVARTPLRDMPAVDPLRTMHGAIQSFVKSPKLRQFLGRFATYVGASPYLAPATLNVIADVELSGGVWYPQGGIYAIARAFQRRAEELGVEIVKVFPGAEVGGPEFVKNVTGPMPWTRIMPTGGVEPTEESLRKWLAAGIVACGVGSNLITKKLLDAKDYAGLQANVREAVSLARRLKAELASKT